MHLAPVGLGGEARHHVGETLHQRGIALVRRQHHALCPDPAERSHALIPGKVEHFLTASRLALAYRVHGRIQQRQPLDARRRGAQHFERDAPAHREPGQGKAWRRMREYRRGHRRQVVVVEDMRDLDVVPVTERGDLRGPEPLVAKRTG